MLFYENHMTLNAKLKYVIRYSDDGFYAVPAPSYKGPLPKGFTTYEDVMNFARKTKGNERVR